MLANFRTTTIGDVHETLSSLLAGLALVGLSLLALPASAAKIYTMAVQSTGQLRCW